MSSRFWQWNEFGNRSIFDRVTAYKNAHFLGTTLFKKNARASHSVTANKGDYHANNAARNTQTESFVDGVRNMRVVKDDVETERDGSQRYSSTDQICNRKKNTHSHRWERWTTAWSGFTGGSKNLKRGRGTAGDSVSAPSYFIANTHNELYAFYAGKTTCWQKNWDRGRQPLPIHPSPLNPPLYGLRTVITVLEVIPGGRFHKQSPDW